MKTQKYLLKSKDISTYDENPYEKSKFEFTKVNKNTSSKESKKIIATESKKIDRDNNIVLSPTNNDNQGLNSTPDIERKHEFHFASTISFSSPKLRTASKKSKIYDERKIPHYRMIKPCTD